MKASLKKIVMLAVLCPLSGCLNNAQYVELGNTLDDKPAVIDVSERPIVEYGDNSELIRPDIRAWIETLPYSVAELAAIKQMAYASQQRFGVDIRNKKAFKSSVQTLATAMACIKFQFRNRPSGSEDLAQMVLNHTEDTQFLQAAGSRYTNALNTIPRIRVEISEIACDQK